MSFYYSLQSYIEERKNIIPSHNYVTSQSGRALTNSALYIIIALLIATTILVTPAPYLSLIYPISSVVIALLSRSMSTTLMILFINTILFSETFEKITVSITQNILSKEFISLVLITISYILLIIYLIIFIILKIKKGYLKDYMITSILTLRKYYKNLFYKNRRKVLYQLFCASILTFAVFLINPYLLPNTFYSYAITIPLYILAIPLFTRIRQGIVSLMVFVSSLKYPPTIFLLYYMSNIETLDIVEKLIEREGAKIGYVVAVLLELPLIKYQSEQIVHEAKSNYAWAPVVETTPYRLHISASSNPHIIITGTSGSGKSYLASRIALRVASITNSSIIILDPHGEYKTLLKECLVIDAQDASINPLDLYGKSPRRRALEVASIIASIFKLGPLQTRLLEDAILITYETKGILDNLPETWNRKPPTLYDVAQVLRSMASKDKRAYLVATYVETLSSKVFSNTSITMNELITAKQPVVIDLSGIGDREWQRLYMELFLEKLYILIKEKGLSRKIRVILLVDEAHLIASKNIKRNIIATMSAELRKYGLSLILITQRLDEMDKTILANMGTKIALRQVEPKIARYVAEGIALSNEKEEIDVIVKTIGMLPLGYAVVRDYYIREPLLVQIE